MDYIALNHDSNKVNGIIYNSKKPIGGIHYYNDKTRPVRVEQDPTSGRKQAFVEIENKFAQKKEEFLEEHQEEIKKIGEKFSKKYFDDYSRKEKLIAEKLSELEEEKEKFEARLAKRKEREFERVSRQIERQKERERREKEKQKENYYITINNQKVDFKKEGIEKAEISWTDKEWLAKAQHYFITAKEKGRAIGSAEGYTSMEALEALWSTAVHVGVDPKRFIVQMYNETRFNPFAKGAAGERGLGQFKKTTANAYGYDWSKMTGGINTYAYQAKAAAEFVKSVGEVAYNGKGASARRYRDKISKRINSIAKSSSTCVLKNPELCLSST